jgi:hypothetical protein
MKTTLGRSIKIRPKTKLSILLGVESATSDKMFLLEALIKRLFLTLKHGRS